VASDERASVDDLTYALALARAVASCDPPAGGTVSLVRVVRPVRGAADRLAEADWDVLEGAVGAIVQAAVAHEVAAAGEAYPPRPGSRTSPASRRWSRPGSGCAPGRARTARTPRRAASRRPAASPSSRQRARRDPGGAPAADRRHSSVSARRP
jgi:hypothetical protein